ncbi:MAG TPA: SMP-30/gluconolactonase/LRE family protein [Bryobacteraceae bacterium]|nr:SMP-30/gluconolactonase/LRE family protein [Bryobacteraceae bacterium]
MQVFEAKPFYTPETEALRFLPEGPRVLQNFPSPDPVLGWVAIQESFAVLQGSMNLLNLRTGTNDVHPLPGRVGFFAETDRPGVIAVGLERDLALYDLRERQLTGKRFRVTDDERVVINDGLAVEGGLLFGTKHITFQERIACMYFFEAATGKLHTLHDAQICANGKFLYNHGLVDIDSFNKTLDHYTFDRAGMRLGERQIIADFRDTPLFPDGLRAGPDGKSVIVAFYNPEPAAEGLAREFRIRDGEVLAEWRLPGSPRVTCPEILERDGRVKVLFTTAVEGMDPAVPLAGTLYLADTAYDRLPEPPPLFACNALL